MNNEHPLWEASEEADEALGPVAAQLRALLAEVPAADESRMRAHRSAFLTAGAALAAPAARPPRRWQRLLGRAAAFALLLLLTFGALDVAAARSVPGEGLYPVKLALEQFEAPFYAAPQWEQRLAATRHAEAMALAARGQQAAIEFTGRLGRAGSQWQVGGLVVPMNDAQGAIAARACPGSVVQVRAQVHADGSLTLTHLTPSCVTLTLADQGAAPSPEPLILPDSEEPSSERPHESEAQRTTRVGHS